MDTLSGQKWSNEEVTGVSRSGRVRKKSSKLDDFEPQEKIKRTNLKVHFQDQVEQMGGSGEDYKKNGNNSGVMVKHEVEESETSEGEFDDVVNDGDSYSMESHTEEEEEEEVDPLMIDEHDLGYDRLETCVAASQANSLYMMEKNRKKVCVKDGKIVGRVKAQRKDKGKTRFTAYMLWAKEIRQELTEKCPYMDFAAISKRLGELWATVPNVEKYNWRRRAKRLAAKPNAQLSLKDETMWKIPAPSLKKKFINKIGNGKDIKSSPPPPKKVHVVLHKPVHSADYLPSRSTKQLVNEQQSAGIGTGMYKVIGTEPVDVAAHLKLLGESLTIIGERLKEHDGQIAVSGSLSVLLDSLLCALGPLMCLTQQIPEVDVVKPQIFSKMLDNIAYIMPGL